MADKWIQIPVAPDYEMDAKGNVRNKNRYILELKNVARALLENCLADCNSACDVNAVIDSLKNLAR